jgi:peptide/nickel transport system substrate-binding protein
MANDRYSRRDFLAQTALAAGGALVLGGCSDQGTAGSDKAPLTSGGVKLPDIEGGTVITDPGEWPKNFAESPEFKSQVAAGKLPPVAERVGQDPLVVKPLHEVGKYGGEIRRGYIGVGDFQNANRFCAGPDNLLFWDYKQDKINPNIAKGYELSNGDTVLTLHLRRGMKWSDGHPFTADDIIFWREDINLNPDLGKGSAALRIGKQPVKVEKVDDFTVKYVSAKPHPLLPAMLAGWSDVGGFTQNAANAGGGYAPKHYLSKFHPKYTPKAQVEAQARAAGLKDWSAFFLKRSDWSFNPELPTLTPWTVTRPINNSPWTFEANPYSIWVDNEGNQLPYIQKITMRDAKNQEVLTLRAVAGEYDFQDRGLAIASLPVLSKGQERSKYKIYRSPTTATMDLAIRVNLAYMKDKVLGDLLRNVDFRRALSLGIDRNQINQTFVFGTCTPGATMVAEDSPYFPGKQWQTKWATFDSAQANQLLDKIGLTAKDSAGYRMRPDGKGRIRLEFGANKTRADYPGMGEMIKRQWKNIGIDMSVVIEEGGLSLERIFSNEVVLQGIGGGGDDPFLRADNILPTNNQSGVIGIPYAKWFNSGGKEGFAPPAELKLLTDMMELRERGLSAPEAERNDIGKTIFKTHADQVWSIGVLGQGMTSYGLYYAKSNLGNVPARVINSETMKSPLNALPMTFYYK